MFSPSPLIRCTLHGDPLIPPINPAPSESTQQLAPVSTRATHRADIWILNLRTKCPRNVTGLPEIQGDPVKPDGSFGQHGHPMANGSRSRRIGIRNGRTTATVPAGACPRADQLHRPSGWQRHAPRHGTRNLFRSPQVVRRLLRLRSGHVLWPFLKLRQSSALPPLPII